MSKQRPFAAFDIDGTLIRWQLYHALVDQLARRGYGNSSWRTQIHDARMNWKNRSHEEAFKSYEHELVEIYESILTSITPNQFSEVVDDVFDEYKDQVYVYTRELIKELKRQNYLLFALSGSQVEIVQKIAEYYGFDDVRGTIYVQEGGKFTGKVILLHLKKDEVLKELAAKHNATFAGSVAIGDSAGDSKMMEVVERPIAFNPEAKLYKIAEEKGWNIVLERKNMIYELESQNGKYELVKTNL